MVISAMTKYLAYTWFYQGQEPQYIAYMVTYASLRAGIAIKDF